MAMACDGLYIYALRASTLLSVFIVFHWILYRQRFEVDPARGTKFCIAWGLIKITLGIVLWLAFDLEHCDDPHYEFVFCLMIGFCILLVGWLYYLKSTDIKTPLITKTVWIKKILSGERDDVSLENMPSKDAKSSDSQDPHLVIV